jgi:hypothetical protein
MRSSLEVIIARRGVRGWCAVGAREATLGDIAYERLKGPSTALGYRTGLEPTARLRRLVEETSEAGVTCLAVFAVLPSTDFFILFSISNRLSA